MLAGGVGWELEAETIMHGSPRPSALRSAFRGFAEDKSKKQRRKARKKEREQRDKSLRGGGLSWQLEAAADPFSIHKPNSALDQWIRKVTSPRGGSTASNAKKDDLI